MLLLPPAPEVELRVLSPLSEACWSLSLKVTCDEGGQAEDLDTTVTWSTPTSHSCRQQVHGPCCLSSALVQVCTVIRTGMYGTGMYV